jgi:type I restriction enzyme S subunit
MTQGWERKRLADVVEIVSGQVDPTLQPYCDAPHVGGENIESGSGRIIDVKSTKQLGLRSGKYWFGREDVLYSKIRPNLNKVALPAFDGICSADIYPLRPSTGKMSREFLAHLLRSKGFLGYAEKHSNRTNIPKLNRESLLAYETVVPPLAEQRRIAAILDQAEALRAKRCHTLAKLDTLTQSLFFDLFGDPATNPKGWPTTRLGEIGNAQGGLQLSASRSHLPREVPYLRVANVYRDALDLREIKTFRATDAEVDRTLLVVDDLLIVEGHGNPDEIGRCALWDGSLTECSHQNHLIRVRLDRGQVHPVFVTRYLNSAGGRRDLLRAGKTTSGLNTISVSNVRDARLFVPPLPLQREFAAQVSAVERLKASQRASLTKLDALFASLQHRAFRGEL